MEDGVQRVTVALADALARGDAAAAAALYADDGKLLTSAAELIAGRRQIEEYWQAGIAVGLTSVELRAVDLQLVRDVAVEIGRYSLALDGNGRGPTCDSGKYLVLHRRQADGAWRRAVDVFNPDVPIAARRDNEED